MISKISIILTILIYTCYNTTASGEEKFIRRVNQKLAGIPLSWITAHDYRRRLRILNPVHSKAWCGDVSELNPTKNQDMSVTKGELSNFRKAEEARKAAEEAGKKKKANEDAERTRKAMEDKRGAEEQERKRKAEQDRKKERKRKAEQDRKNAEDAERLRNEEAERQRNEEAQGDGCSYKSLLNCKPTEFHGDSDPVIVTYWLKEIEDIFEISECSRGRWLKYESHLLEGEARHWWNMIKIARGNEVVSAMTWEQFEELVMENYCPQRLMDKLEEEFLKLQNDMKIPCVLAGKTMAWIH